MLGLMSFEAVHQENAAGLCRSGRVQELDVALLVSLLKQENAADICVIRVAPELRYTEHMIIVSGSSPRHLSAIAELLLRAVRDELTHRETFTPAHESSIQHTSLIVFECVHV